MCVGMRVFVHGCAATPLTLLSALAKHGVDAKLKDVELIHIHTEGPAIYVQPEYDGMDSFFIPEVIIMSVGDAIRQSCSVCAMIVRCRFKTETWLADEMLCSVESQVKMLVKYSVIWQTDHKSDGKHDPQDSVFNKKLDDLARLEAGN